MRMYDNLRFVNIPKIPFLQFRTIPLLNCFVLEHSIFKTKQLRSLLNITGAEKRLKWMPPKILYVHSQ